MGWDCHACVYGRGVGTGIPSLPTTPATSSATGPGNSATDGRFRCARYVPALAQGTAWAGHTTDSCARVMHTSAVGTASGYQREPSGAPVERGGAHTVLEVRGAGAGVVRQLLDAGCWRRGWLHCDAARRSSPCYQVRGRACGAAVIHPRVRVQRSDVGPWHPHDAGAQCSGDWGRGCARQVLLWQRQGVGRQGLCECSVVWHDTRCCRLQIEPGAVVARVAPSFIRFGSFELPVSLQSKEMLKQLADYTINTHHPDLALQDLPDDEK